MAASTDAAIVVVVVGIAVVVSAPDCSDFTGITASLP